MEKPQKKKMAPDRASGRASHGAPPLLEEEARSAPRRRPRAVLFAVAVGVGVSAMSLYAGALARESLSRGDARLSALFDDYIDGPSRHDDIDDTVFPEDDEVRLLRVVVR